ncbi:hypothetical protein V5O48_017859, partial [Marasmius crinis-equi]
LHEEVLASPDFEHEVRPKYGEERQDVKSGLGLLEKEGKDDVAKPDPSLLTFDCIRSTYLPLPSKDASLTIHPSLPVLLLDTSQNFYPAQTFDDAEEEERNTDDFLFWDSKRAEYIRGPIKQMLVVEFVASCANMGRLVERILAERRMRALERFRGGPGWETSSARGVCEREQELERRGVPAGAS